MKIILSVNTLASFIAHRRSLYLKLRESHDVKVILPDSEAQEASQLQELPSQALLKLPMSRKGVNPLSELFSIFAYLRHYQKAQPDLVHHFTIKPVIYGTIAARLAAVPRIVNTITGLGYVFTSESTKAKILKVIVRNLYRFCFASRKVRIIFQNIDDREFFIQQGIVRKENCFLVEGSGVDTQKFVPKENTHPFPRILLASRLLIEKGIFEFIEAIDILKKKGLQFEAVIAGDPDPGNPGSVTVEQYNQWKISDTAQFLGFQNDMAGLLNSTDIACLPSYREGVPMSLLEALAAGKPVVTTDAPGCRSTVINGKNGFLVPVKNSAALAEALEKLIKSPELRTEMGQESRKMAVEFFSKEKIVAKIQNVYSF